MIEDPLENATDKEVIESKQGLIKNLVDDAMFFSLASNKLAAATVKSEISEKEKETPS